MKETSGQSSFFLCWAHGLSWVENEATPLLHHDSDVQKSCAERAAHSTQPFGNPKRTKVTRHMSLSLPPSPRIHFMALARSLPIPTGCKMTGLGRGVAAENESMHGMTVGRSGGGGVGPPFRRLLLFARQ